MPASLTSLGRTTVAAAVCLLVLSAASAQSGSGSLRGSVAFETIPYSDLPASKVRATIELRGNTSGNQSVLTAETNERGAYEIEQVPAGEYVLTISCPGFKDYRIELFIPSDFLCNIATMMKSKKTAPVR